MQSLTNKSGSDKGGTAVSILGILVLLAFSVGIAVFLNKVPDGGLETLCLLLGLLPALILGFTSSVYQVPYILSVWAIEPELRRLIDWSYGQYHSITVMTLLPILATMTLLLPIVRRRRSINKGLRPGIYLYCAALAYGLMIGWIHNGFAAAYEFVTYVVPLLLVFYMYQRPFTDAQRSMIFRSFSGIAILIAIYGWIQYLTAPAWDTFWRLFNSEFTGPSGSVAWVISVHVAGGAPMATVFGMARRCDSRIGACPHVGSGRMDWIDDNHDGVYRSVARCKKSEPIDCAGIHPGRFSHHRSKTAWWRSGVHQNRQLGLASARRLLQ
jgi:hypothetical protein